MAKRLSLRDFQESLSARLQSAKRGETAPPMLGFRAGGRRWLLELPDSGEVVPLPTLSPVPLTQPWFAGMANIRGGLHAVVDFAQFAGAPPVPRGERSRLLRDRRATQGRHFRTAATPRQNARRQTQNHCLTSCRHHARTNLSRATLTESV